MDKAVRGGDLPANREADDPVPLMPEARVVTVSTGTTQVRGLREVMSAGRGEIVDGMIQGDLVGSV
jgi:hypothetical protein